jgi:signal transduction histidine kinase
MKRRPFFWGLILGTLATRLAFGRGLDRAEVSDMPTFTVGVLVAAAGLGAAVLFVVAWVLAFRKARRRSTEPPPSPAPSPDPSLEADRDEARRQLAARSEQLVFTRELLQKRTEDMDRLAAERTAMASRLDEAQAAADRWRVKYEQAATEMEAERARFATEQTRLAGELMRGTLDASQRAHEMLDSMRELVRRTEETNALRVEVAGLRAELERARSAAPAPPAPPELIEQEARRLYGGALESLCFEVRRALNAVLGYARLPMYDAASRHQQDDVRALEVAGERLLGFVNDLHDLSRAEAKALVLEPEAVDVESALRQAARDATERLQRKLSDFLVAAEPGLPRVRADRTRLAQILAALVQYGGSAKTVLSARSAGEFVVLGVAHPDLTVADGARLFDPLAANGEDGATRVQFALARALATLSGGELTVTAGEVAGTVFTLTLPTAARGEGVAGPRARPRTDA